MPQAMRSMAIREGGITFAGCGQSYPLYCWVPGVPRLEGLCGKVHTQFPCLFTKHVMFAAHASPSYYFPLSREVDLSISFIHISLPDVPSDPKVSHFITQCHNSL